MGKGQKQKAREKAVKKKRAKEKQRRKVSKEGRRPDYFIVQYDSPDTLAVVGPLVQASWSIPPALEQRLLSLGRSVPPTVDGYLLIDTGASRTAIALDVAQELQLRPVYIGETYGAGGLHPNPVFYAALKLEIVDRSRRRTVVGYAGEAMGIPDLGKAYEKLRLADGQRPRLIGLLGREFLRHTTLTYDGSAGMIKVKLDLKTFRIAAGQVER